MVGADTSGDGLVDAISRFHRSSAGSRIHAVAFDAHGGGHAGAVTVQVKLPPSVIAPISVIVSFIVIITVPYPIRLPPRTPDTPACRVFNRSAWDSGGAEAVVSVIGYGIGRRVLIKVKDFDVEGRFRRTAGTGYRHLNCHVLLSIGGLPFYPRKLAIAFGVVDIAHTVGLPTDIKADAGGPVGIGLTSADPHRRDDIGVYPVLIIVGVNLRFLRFLRKTDNAKSKAGLDIRIGCGAAFAASPCGIAEVAYLQKHGEGQILVGKRHHSSAEQTANLFII